jgi:hypothetical protein
MTLGFLLVSAGLLSTLCCLWIFSCEECNSASLGDLIFELVPRSWSYIGYYILKCVWLGINSQAILVNPVKTDELESSRFVFRFSSFESKNKIC